ncbi:hypothetical protein [Glutamicibacter sp. V16R2B1]|uniref:hypothetical protein n=1 Tax=Glutamicibacter sp. V16R2B1 TaxID=2036207 RepID=UPI0010FDA450|nr:hypothetical protein [Glutamicibacter sp. V16R2B1]TLK47198.1 hypothetical protein FDN03_15920 [Glutamicibacter sp. V16R2B1]
MTLPPGYQLVIVPPYGSSGLERDVIATDSEVIRTRDEAVALAWADHRRSLIEAHLRQATGWSGRGEPARWPEPIRSECQRILALNRVHRPTDAYLEIFPEDGPVMTHALATGDPSGLRDLTNLIWRDDTHQYEILPMADGGTSAVRRRRTDLRFRFEFSGRLVYDPEFERDYSGHADPTFTIGGRDFVTELEDDKGYAVTATLNGETAAEGTLHVSMGSQGYSWNTPGDADELKVGDVDLILALMRLSKLGENEVDVTLVIEQVPAGG